MNIEVSVLTIGITQIIKYLFPQLQGRSVVAVALAVGIALFTMQELLAAGALGAATETVELIVRVIAGSIAIPGWVGVVKDDLLPAIGMTAH